MTAVADHSAVPPDTAPPPKWPSLAQSRGGLRLLTLIRLRWMAVFGQLSAILVVYFIFEWPLPFSLCMAAIALSAWLNIFLGLRHRANARLSDRHTSWILAYDIIQLAVLLYLTGGLQNPFAFLFLVPVTVSASSLPLDRTLLLGALAFSLSTVLAFHHLPLPWDPDASLNLPRLYLFGVWSAVLCGTAFAAMFAWRISEETRQMSAALAATEMVLAREQQLSALDGLAAAAAHELGTPLATIQLVAKELKREFPEAGAHQDDLELLNSQAARCREILTQLANRTNASDTMHASFSVSVMLEEMVEPLRGSGVQISVTLPEGLQTDEPNLPRNPGILFGLGNLLENAVDFARTTVEIDASWSEDELRLIIKDDGPGISQDVIDRLGEPYVTTRPGYAGEAEDVGEDHQGMGLGFFIAKTLLERSGATVVLAQRPPPEQGALATVVWPHSAFGGLRNA
ncbi:MAG: ActS/PrrB/RegB family redox-sensitive histidine kinase [Pseudomonadota bacterium]